MIALSSLDQDHLAGLTGVLDRCRADTVAGTVLERAPGTTAAYASWQKAIGCLSHDDQYANGRHASSH